MVRFVIFAQPARRSAVSKAVKKRFPDSSLSYAASSQQLKTLISRETCAAVVVDPEGLAGGLWRALRAVMRARPHLPVAVLAGECLDGGVAARAQIRCPGPPATRRVRRRRFFLSLEDLQARLEWRRVLAQLAVPAFLVSGRGTILEANEAAAALAGPAIKGVSGHRCAEVLQCAGERSQECPLFRARKTGRAAAAEFRPSPDHARLECCAPVLGNDGRPLFFLHISVDPAARCPSDLWQRVAEKILETTSDGVAVTDAARTILWVNRVITEVTGYAPGELIGRTPFFLLASGEENGRLPQEAEDKLAANGRWEGQVWYRGKNGEVFPRWVTVSTVQDTEGRVLRYVSVCANPAHKAADPQNMAHAAHHDALTGLGNRLQFYDRFEATASLALRRGLALALFYVDIDRFGSINGAFGYAAGDQVLRAVAGRLRAAVRAEDTVVRVAGDEFALLLTLQREEDAGVVGRKILACLRDPIWLAGRALRVSASVGVALYPADGDEPDALLRAARAAADRAKEHGRGGLAFCGRELQNACAERFLVEQELARALEAGELVVYYQPRFRLREGRICGAEALVRWCHPERGILLPGAFIEVAEASGLIVPLDEQVLRAACAQARTWQEQGFDLTVSVNLSARHFHKQNLVATLARILEETGLRPDRLELEITETAAVKNVDLTGSILADLRSLGAGIAIDDFGTGYGSLQYLRRFPVSTLKIDRSFVRGLPANRQDAAIAAAVIVLARSLGATVVAEGVETSEQPAWLEENGCDEIQGFLISPPVPASELVALLADRATKPLADTPRGGGRQSFPEAGSESRP